jgi:hypothetical protein
MNSKYETFHHRYQIEKVKRGIVKSHLTKVTKKQMNKLVCNGKLKSSEKLNKS